MSLKNSVIPPGIDPGTDRLVAQSLNHYATPGPLLCYWLIVNEAAFTWNAVIILGKWLYGHPEHIRFYAVTIIKEVTHLTPAFALPQTHMS